MKCLHSEYTQLVTVSFIRLLSNFTFLYIMQVVHIIWYNLLFYDICTQTHEKLLLLVSEMYFIIPRTVADLHHEMVNWVPSIGRHQSMVPLRASCRGYWLTDWSRCNLGLRVVTVERYGTVRMEEGLHWAPHTLPGLPCASRPREQLLEVIRMEGSTFFLPAFPSGFWFIHVYGP